MNFILCLLIVTYFCLLEVKCRSVQLDSDFHSVLEDGEDKDVNHDPESNGIFSWKKLKPILRREVQRIRNVKDETNEVNEETRETIPSIPFKVNDKDIEVGKEEENFLKLESEITDPTSVKLELNKPIQNENPTSESNVAKEFAPSETHSEMPDLNHPSFASDFSDNVISDILNRSSDSLLFQSLNDNSSEVGSLEFDETSLLSEGGHVATLQEVSTLGFELLIDSETTQNLILAELLSSQSNLINGDDFDNATDEDDLSVASIQFNHINGSDLQEITTDEYLTGDPDNTEFDEDDARTENTEFNTDDETATKDHEFDIDGEFETEDIAFSTGEFEIENIDINTGETKNLTNLESELTDSVENDNITENRRTEAEEPKCPDPGWCIFWFLALDTCAKDFHCHGSLLCCMMGCSKTCVDPVEEF